MEFSVDEGIKATTIDNENIRLTMSVKKGEVYLGENLIINFEVRNESADNAWLNGYRLFYFDVYDENHVKIGTWLLPIITVYCRCPGHGWRCEPVPPGGFYSENLVWDLTAYRENYDYWYDDNWDRTWICSMASSVAIEVCPPCWPRYERVELEPGTYYLEGHAFYTKWYTKWSELVTPLLEITILSSEPI